MIVWTEAYRPFVMGGKVNYPIGTEISNKKLGRKIDLGKGFFGHSISSPVTGQTHIIEATTGAFIGTDLSKVKADIEACSDVEVMQVQISEGAERAKEVEVVSNEEFWKKFRSESE
jgi:hypothetical protein